MAVDSEHLRRMLISLLPTGTRAAELFVESRHALGIDLNAETGAPKIVRRWESGAHLRRFFDGRHESFVLDAPDAGALESLIRHPASISAPGAFEEASGTLHELWSPGSLDRALEIVNGAVAAAQGSPASRCNARLEAHVQEIVVISTERDTARDTRTSAELSLEIHGDRRAPATMRRAAPSLAGLGAGTRDSRSTSDLFPGMAATATPGPSGEMPVIFVSPSGGFLLHEICGHLLEADHVLAGDSPFAGARGEAIASPLLSLADDGSLPGLRGSARFDDEGIPSRRTPLIVKGTLVGYLSSRLTAHATGRISTGNGRRQTYRDAPMPRMTNLVVDSGETSFEEILASTPAGLLVHRLGRGQVDPATGSFMLAVESAMLVERGRPGRPVRGVVLRGVAHQALAAIDAVGNDVSADPAGAMCVKEDQAIPFGTRQPTLRLSSLHVAEAGR